MTPAPIVLFVYNRPAHTRRTVEALLKNKLGGESDLNNYSDAPKEPEAIEVVRDVRQYIKTTTGFRSISIVERDKNYGSADSVIDGVTPAVNKFGLIIVRDAELSKTPISLNAIKVEPSQAGRQAFEKFFRQNQTGLLRRLTRKASTLLKACR
jgi:hypothetical protein